MKKKCILWGIVVLLIMLSLAIGGDDTQNSDILNIAFYKKQMLVKMDILLHLLQICGTSQVVVWNQPN